MSEYKVSNFISKEFETIIKDSREYRAYDLGMASGFFHLYKYMIVDIGEEKAKEQFKLFMDGNERMYEYFNELLRLDKEENTKAEDMVEKLNKYKNKCE